MACRRRASPSEPRRRSAAASAPYGRASPRFRPPSSRRWRTVRPAARRTSPARSGTGVAYSIGIRSPSPAASAAASPCHPRPALPSAAAAPGRGAWAGGKRGIADQADADVVARQQAHHQAHAGPRIAEIEVLAWLRRSRPRRGPARPSRLRIFWAVQPSAVTALAVCRTSSPSSRPVICVRPVAMAPSIRARCEMDLSPGTRAVPLSARAFSACNGAALEIWDKAGNPGCVAPETGLERVAWSAASKPRQIGAAGRNCF